MSNQNGCFWGLCIGLIIGCFVFCKTFETEMVQWIQAIISFSALWRWGIFGFGCFLHFWFCGRINIQSIQSKQPKKGNFNGAYAKELKEKHGSLGNLINIAYTDFWIVKRADIKLCWWRYWLGLILLFALGWFLFVLPE